MNTGKSLRLLGFVVLYFLTIACRQEAIEPTSPVALDPVTTPSTQNSTVNNWVYEVMKDAYYWTKNLPVQSTLNASLNPSDYFEKLIYQRATLDRFSGITDDIASLQKEFNGVSKIFGIQYQLAYTDQSQSSVGLFLSYVVKGSPAEAAGLKRGDIILKVNGQALTNSNYSTLLRSGESVNFTLGTYNGTSLMADNTKSFNLTKAEVAENPVGFSTVIEKASSGKKIGYLVYTQFVPGSDATSKQYDDQLRQIFADFKAKGVNELVLDLRFNGGGYISSAETLASLIGKNISTSKVFYKEKWNDQYTAYFQKEKGPTALNHTFLNEPNNIGANLSRVFVLTSNSTASASELVINGLKPYMPVITIGANTYGKNLFGTLIDDDQKRWNWGLYVMLGQTANANDESDYGTINGIAPTYKVDDTVIPFRSFGDDNETLFSKVLNVMGVPTAPSARLGETTRVTPLRDGFLKDNLQSVEKPMIQDFPRNL
jgi:carboxyl-terminal processing protease